MFLVSGVTRGYQRGSLLHRQNPGCATIPGTVITYKSVYFGFRLFSLSFPIENIPMKTKNDHRKYILISNSRFFQRKQIFSRLLFFYDVHLYWKTES